MKREELAKLEILASLKDEGAIFSLASVYQEEHDYVKAFSYLTRLVNSNNSEYLRKIGYFFERGLGVDKDLEKAFEFYLKSAEAGDLVSQYNVALCYLNGIGTKKDPKKAFEFAKQSSEQNYKKSQVLLATLYKNGVGVEKNLTKAFEIISSIPELGKDEYYLKGLILLNPDFPRINESLGIECLEKSSELGSLEALTLLAEFYLRGKILPKEEGKAVSILLKAAKMGYPKAMSLLSECYANGLGVNKNEDIADFWQKASKKKI